MTHPVLTARGLTKGFGVGPARVQALVGVDLEVPAGQVTGLIGPDGAGKTSLMRLAAGLLVPDLGQIQVLGQDATRESLAVQALVGYMPQRFGLYEDLRVQENLNLYADLHGLPVAERPARYRELLAMTGLAPFTARLAGRLSGGMKQKLGLACTLVRTPELLLLDEPTVGVDPVSRRELWVIVHRLVAEQGTSVLLSTSYMDEAARCDQVILIHGGQVIGQGPPEAFTRPLTGRTFLARVPENGRRKTQAGLAALPEVLDATRQGDGVRLVTRTVGLPDLSPAGIATADCVAIPARFEDAFVARLGGGHAPALALPQTRRIPLGQDLIRVEGLSRRFGDFTAVDRISFAVGPGEVFGLLGANGAGKTTTFRMLCGLLPASGGTLRVAGVDLGRAPAQARARIGYMSQKFSLYGNLTVAQNLEFFSRIYGLRGAMRQARLAAALAELDLEPHAATASADLSLGHKQRLALACALLHEPDILFLDEPTSGVDPLARREFWSRINALAEAGVAVLVTTHFMEEAESCDRLAIMAAGAILALGTPAQIKARTSATSLEEAFLALVEGGGEVPPAAEDGHP